MDPKKKAEIARQNGAKSKGPVTAEGKDHSRRNALTHGERATALKLIIPPHSACLANEDRQAFYKLYDSLTAKYRPTDDAELAVVREIADYQWKINRNKQMDTAIFNRELMRQGTRITPTLPELLHIEISIAAQEALTGNRTIAELRKDSQACLRAIYQLQRRLAQMQKLWPAAKPAPPVGEINELDEEPAPADNRTDETGEKFDANGAVTHNVIELYRNVFHKESLELVGHEPLDDPEAA